MAEQPEKHHTEKIRGMLDDVARHCREDVEKVDDPHAKALYETTAEVLGGLMKAYEHYAKRSEEAWR